MTGHIRRRGTSSFELKFEAGIDPVTRRRKIRYVSFKGTKKAAQIELARLISEYAAGVGVDPSTTTLAEFLDRWERDWAKGNVSPKTLERYTEILRKHVRARVGTVRIQKLRPADLATLYATLLREGKGAGIGLAARTVGHVHRVLHRALGHAAQWGVVQQNVASLVSPPRVPSTEIEALSPKQIQSVLQKLRGRTIYPIAVLALATGMRRGELLALRWQDVKLDRSIIQVERSLEQTDAGLRFKAPKTRHGRRSVSLPPSAVAELRAHWKDQAALRLKLGMGKMPDDGLVFARWDGEPRHPDAFTKEWSTAMKAAGLPGVTFHSLRHSHASHLIASGLDVLTISRRLGHANPTITLNVYGHLISNTDDRAAQIMESALASPAGGNPVAT